MTTASRPTRRFRPIHFALSLLLALAGVLAFTAPASAATGEIIVTVTDTDGNPISGAEIYLSDDIGGVGGPSGPAFSSTVPIATTGPTGVYTISGVPDGVYLVLAEKGDDWVQDSVFMVVDNSLDPSGYADLELEKGVLITGTVRPESNPASTLGGIAVGALMNDPDTTCGCGGGLYGDDLYFDILTFDWDTQYPMTPPGGTYRIVVPLGHNYELNAQDPTFAFYEEQSWDHQRGSGGGCGCGGGGDFTPVFSPDDSAWPYGAYPATSAINFDLRAFADHLWFQVKTVRNPGPADYPGVHVFLQYDSGGPSWHDVADDVSDADGFVNFYVPDDGDYRLRFEVGGVEVAVVDAVDGIGCGCATSYGLDENDTKVVLGYYTKSSPGAGYFGGSDAEVTFAAAPSGGGGSGTPAPPAPRKPPRTGTSLDIGSLITPSVTPTPSATPTSTPSPSPTQSGDPEPTPTPTPDIEPSGDTGFPWWIILIIVLILGIVITVIVIVRRR